MAFNPIDYYHLAGWLYAQQNPHDEARARAIISKGITALFLRQEIELVSPTSHSAYTKKFMTTTSMQAG